MATGALDAETKSCSRRALSTPEAVIDRLIEEHGGRPGLCNLAPGAAAFRPSAEAMRASCLALTDPSVSGYGDVLGWQPLRERWLEHLARHWSDPASGIACDSAERNKVEHEDVELMVTAGANQGFINAVLAVCDVGDEVVLLQPYYFSHHSALLLCGVVPVVVDCDAATLLPPSALSVKSALTKKSSAVVIVNPGNPSGKVMPPALLDEIVSVCNEAGVWLILDEAYKEFVFGSTPHYSPRFLSCRIIKLYTMSKVFGMAGWRVGAVVYPKTLSTEMRKIQDTIPTHAPIPSQISAFHVLQVDSRHIHDRIRRLNAVRLPLAEALAEAHSDGAEDTGSAPFVLPDGAFYFFVPVLNAVTHCEAGDPNQRIRKAVSSLVLENKVLVTPGDIFGMPEYIRISYGALSTDDVEECSTRLKTGIARLLHESQRSKTR